MALWSCPQNCLPSGFGIRLWVVLHGVYEMPACGSGTAAYRKTEDAQALCKRVGFCDPELPRPSNLELRSSTFTCNIFP